MMNAYMITIDGGTTNTRAFLWNSRGQVAASAKAAVGVQLTAETGSNQALKETVRRLIDSLLEERSIKISDVGAIYASGMITSNVGLLEVPHLIAPVSLKDFASGVVLKLLPDVCPVPIHFIPGMKNMPDSKVTLENLESMDIMRGEETEALALLDYTGLGGDCLLVLPGSHTKFITVDAAGRLTGCLTSLSGELLAAITQHTVVADAVERSFVNQEWDPSYLLAGFYAAHDTSCARGAFLTRIARQFLTDKQNQCASFLLGAVLENDIAAIRSSHALKIRSSMRVRIAGKEPLCSALLMLLKETGYFSDIQSVHLPDKCPMAGYGALLIAKERGDFYESGT